VSAQGIADTLPRLGALRTVVDTAEQYRTDRPLKMRWGLYQGNGIGDAARDAYIRELSGSLLPALGDRFRAGLLGTSAEPDRLYEYLKAYLMLSEPKHLEPDQIGFLATIEWRRLFPAQPDIRDQPADSLRRAAGRSRASAPAQRGSGTGANGCAMRCGRPRCPC